MIKSNFIQHKVISSINTRNPFYFLSPIGRRKVHFLLKDGRELVEEYDMDTNVVISRVWKIKNHFGTFVDWEVEIGNLESKQNNLQTVGIQESSNSVCYYYYN
jgi:hypothetical protein